VTDRAAEILEEIRRIARTDLGLPFAVEPGHELVRDLRLDSMTGIVLAVGLEDRFRIILSESDTAGLATVADLVERVGRRIEEQRA
jgi:acyl carrier protein